jgi:hypothetical protein
MLMIILAGEEAEEHPGKGCLLCPVLTCNRRQGTEAQRNSQTGVPNLTKFTQQAKKQSEDSKFR